MRSIPWKASRAGPPNVGIAGMFARLVAGESTAVVVGATVVATLATVAVSVLSSKLGSQLAGEVTSAVRIEMLRAAIHASPSAVEAAVSRAMEAGVLPADLAAAGSGVTTRAAGDAVLAGL